MDWISVKDRLPEINQWVISYSPNFRSSIAITQYEKSTDESFWSLLSSGCGCCDGVMQNVTHWMQLPELPKEK